MSFDDIIQRVNKLVNDLEESKRVKDVFLLLHRENKNNDSFNLEEIGDNFQEDFYSILSLLVELDSIEILDKDATGIRSSIIDDARALFTSLSIFERDDYREFKYLFDSRYNSYLWLFVYLKCLILVYVSSSSFEYDYSEDNVEIALRHATTKNVFFRGHSDIDYKIVPSIVRSLKRTTRVDYSYISRLYYGSDLLNKYQILIDQSAVVDYNFCSFIQHATSYSPLIDFTKEKNIALSFATHPNGNLNSYNSTDASLIVLGVKGIDERDINVSKIDLDYHATKLSVKSRIYGKPIVSCTIDDFDVQFGISTKATNDRMKYQKGVFFCFYRCVIVRGIPLMPWSKGYLLTFRIKAKDNAKKGEPTKQEIYNLVINSHPYYDYQHLMEPYDYFTEYNK